MTDNEDIEILREDIREITSNIILLFGQRQAKSKIIGEMKKLKGMNMWDPDVESDLRNNIIHECKKSRISVEDGLKLLNILVESSRQIQGIESLDKEMMHENIFVKARNMDRQGSEIIHLEIGEPDFDPPKIVFSEINKSLKSGRQRYVEAGGIPELREKIATEHNQKYKSNINSRNVIVTPGGRFAVFLALKSIIKPGNEVIIPEPTWPGYHDITKAIGGEPRKIHTTLDQSWSVPLDELEDNIKQSNSVVILNNPSNPTGKILEAKKMKEIVTMMTNRNGILLCDEVYEDYAFKPFTSILQMQDCKYVKISSFSKSYAMTGFRVGYAIADEELIRKMITIQSNIITSIPEFIQRGAIGAINSNNYVKINAAKIKERISVADKALRNLPVSYKIPDGGLYIFMKVLKDGFNGYKFTLDLLENKHVALAPGSIFGDYPDFLRISLCSENKEILDGIENISEFIS